MHEALLLESFRSPSCVVLPQENRLVIDKLDARRRDDLSPEFLALQKVKKVQAAVEGRRKEKKKINVSGCWNAGQRVGRKSWGNYSHWILEEFGEFGLLPVHQILQVVHEAWIFEVVTLRENCKKSN